MQSFCLVSLEVLHPFTYLLNIHAITFPLVLLHIARLLSVLLGIALLYVLLLDA